MCRTCSSGHPVCSIVLAFNSWELCILETSHASPQDGESKAAYDFACRIGGFILECGMVSTVGGATKVSVVQSFQPYLYCIRLRMVLGNPQNLGLAFRKELYYLGVALSPSASPDYIWRFKELNLS